MEPPHPGSRNRHGEPRPPGPRPPGRAPAALPPDHPAGSRTGTRWSPGTTAEACTVYLFACPEGKSSARGERGRQSKPNGHDLDGDQHQDHADASRQQGQGPRSEPGQGTGPRAKKRATRATTAARATTPTRSPAAGSRPRSCRMITGPARRGNRRTAKRTFARR